MVFHCRDFFPTRPFTTSFEEFQEVIRFWFWMTILDSCSYFLFSECTTRLETGTKYLGNVLIDPNSTGRDKFTKASDANICKSFCGTLNAKFFYWNGSTQRCWCQTALDPNNKMNCSAYCVTGSTCENEETDAKWRDQGSEHMVGFEWLTR